MLSKGYNHKNLSKITNSSLPQKRIFIRNKRDGIFVAPSFKDAAIHFLVDPFLTNDDYFGLGKEGVATFISLDSSMWVIGPPCHSNEINQ